MPVYTVAVALAVWFCESAISAPPWLDAVGDRTVVSASPSADARIREAAGTEPERLRVAARDNFVLMHSFDAMDGDALIRKAVAK